MSESFSSKLKDLQTKYVTSQTNDDANLLVQMNLYDNDKIGNNLNDLEKSLDELEKPNINNLRPYKEEYSAKDIYALVKGLVSKEI